MTWPGEGVFDFLTLSAPVWCSDSCVYAANNRHKLLDNFSAHRKTRKTSKSNILWFFYLAVEEEGTQFVWINLFCASHILPQMCQIYSLGSEVTVSEVIAAEVTVLVNATQIWDLCRIRNILVKSCFSSSSSSFDVNLPQQRAWRNRTLLKYTLINYPRVCFRQ